ncbi:fructose bisphosphate aldolase [Rhizobium ruizarguesonis]|uniref:fructose bisphosphate aldolase n=1 Tax=Rhizobium ruizarguesonis TaxID=2081791 RepID=UPI00102F843A|nr:fructose bisphosphate aldolase [Rhizobium ruizarguesonis]TAT96069.1 fructose bisphosphate aldolase [Rhizobium ruizarguesonis]
MYSNMEMLQQIETKDGIIAALDQSGGSTRTALSNYGIADSEYQDDEQMHHLMHEMRVRIITSTAFVRAKVIGAILFEKTMNSEASGKSVPAFLWEDRGIVPFLKIDNGLEVLAGDIQLLKPIPDLKSRLGRAAGKGIFGTKMRSFIAEANDVGIKAIVNQQFDLARQILASGLIPIVEPEVSIAAKEKEEAELLLRQEITRELDSLSNDQKVVLKLTIPTVPNFYESLAAHRSVIRLAALSGGYSRSDACDKLRRNRNMVASFSRALIEDIRFRMPNHQFDALLHGTIDEIYDASVSKP